MAVPCARWEWFAIAMPLASLPLGRSTVTIVQEAHFRYIYKVTTGMSVSSCRYISLCGIVHLPPDKFV